MNHEVLLQKKLENIFPDIKVREKVYHLLNNYGSESYEQEPYRVRLAVLKLSGSNISKIESITNYAKEDFRDVLTWAEYPRQSKKGTIPEGQKKEKLIEEDRKEYENWLNT